MNRIIGIDYGTKRTGIAVSDPLGMFATALDTISSTKIIDYLKNYGKSNTIIMFVVGYPKNLNNLPAENASHVNGFVKRLQNAFPDVPIQMEDERFTSVIAHQAMIDGGMKLSDRRNKEVVDKISAVIILQSYLDRVSKSQIGTNIEKEDIGDMDIPLSRSKTMNKRPKLALSKIKKRI